MNGLDQVMTNNNNNKIRKGMNSKFLRISLCDCNTGKFISTMSKEEIDYIFQVVIKSSVVTGDWITDEMKEDVIKTLADIKDHYDETFSVSNSSTSYSSSSSSNKNIRKCCSFFNNK